MVKCPPTRYEKVTLNHLDMTFFHSNVHQICHVVFVQETLPRGRRYYRPGWWMNSSQLRDMQGCGNYLITHLTLTLFPVTFSGRSTRDRNHLRNQSKGHVLKKLVGSSVFKSLIFRNPCKKRFDWKLLGVYIMGI